MFRVLLAMPVHSTFLSEDKTQFSPDYIKIPKLWCLRPNLFWSLEGTLRLHTINKVNIEN